MTVKKMPDGRYENHGIVVIAYGYLNGKIVSPNSKIYWNISNDAAIRKHKKMVSDLGWYDIHIVSKPAGIYYGELRK